MPTLKKVFLATGADSDISHAEACVEEVGELSERNELRPVVEINVEINMASIQNNSFG